jgi:hypothetical protein
MKLLLNCSEKQQKQTCPTDMTVDRASEREVGIENEIKMK